MQPLKVVIIGCGNIAGQYDEGKTTLIDPLTHAGAFKLHPDFTVVGCCDPDQQRLSEFCNHWEISTSYNSVRGLISNHPEVDVVSICSPTYLHTAHLSEVLELKPSVIFCEKPVAPSLVETSGLLQQCEEAGVGLAVNYTRRWDPAITELKKQLSSGQWGKLRSVSGIYNKGILNNGSHLIDLLLYLFNGLNIMAVGRPVYDSIDDDPSVPVLMETDVGVPITINIADARDYALFSMTLITENGVIAMENGGLNWSTRRVIDSAEFPGYRTPGHPLNVEGLYKKAMQRAVDNISRFIRHGDPLASTGITAAQAQKICFRIKHSAQQKGD